MIQKIDVHEPELPNEAEGGFMLVEGLGTMLFYLLMLAIGAGVLVSLFSNRDLSQAQQGLSQLRMEIRQLYSASPNYSGLTTEVARSAGVIPIDMDTGSSVVNPWNGAVTLSTGSDSSTFTISYGDVPRESCTKLAMYQHGSWVDVAVGGASINQTTGTVSDATNACGDANTIVFTSN